MIGKNRQWLWTLTAVIYTGFIFHNSMTPATESSRQSGAVLSMVLGMLNGMGLNGSWVTEHLIRKTAHFAEYFLLGVLLWSCLKSYNLPRRLWTVTQLWLATVIPLTDETLQLFTKGRSGQVDDVWLDIAGVITGTLAVAGIWSMRRRRRQKG